MDTYQILAVTIPALIGTLVIFVSKESQLRIKKESDILLEKERNTHEIIMYYLRNEDENGLESEVKRLLDEKFPERAKKIADKVSEIEKEIRQIKVDLGSSKKQTEQTPE